MRRAAITVAAFEEALLLNPRWLDYVKRYHGDLFAKTGGEPVGVDCTRFKPASPEDQSANVDATKWIVDCYVRDMLPE